MTKISESELLNTVREALEIGGGVLRRGFHSFGSVSFKAKNSPVTEVDLESERRIVTLIRRRFPDHDFLTEEGVHKTLPAKVRSGPSAYRWIIDPLDGTVNFIKKIPQACVSVAVAKEGVVVAGGVMDPFRGELFLARRGRGAWMNGKPIRVTPTRRFEQALFITGFPYDRDRYAETYLAVSAPFLKKSFGLRRFGAAAIDMAWVACGRGDGFFEFKLNPWDVAAGSLLVQEAGGRVTDFRGCRYDVTHPIQTLATNGHLHRQVLSILKKGGFSKLFLPES